MNQIKSIDILPNDIIKFEYGDYGNWVTARIDEIRIENPNSYYPLKLIWHYLSDETQKDVASKNCRAEKLGNNPEPGQAYRQFTCYGNLNDIVEKLN